ncbi:MAG: type IX secretion system membrane protein PorP/SprF, partial [Flavobacteriales bacterium]
MALFIWLKGNGQQLPLYTQYQFNPYSINPATAGAKKHYTVRTNYRGQWVGLTDAPRTYTLSVSGPTKDRKMGLGGYIFTDNVGPTRRMGFQFSYAYYFNIQKGMRLGLSLSAGMLQFNIDASKVDIVDPSDQAFAQDLLTTLEPDAKFGAHLHTEKYYVGLVAPQLFRNSLKFDTDQRDVPLKTDSRLKNHFILTGGYEYELNDVFALEPSLLMKYVYPVPVQLDVGTRVIYNDNIWLGLQYRSQDAITTMLGYRYKKNLS